jgi:tetratricopeptide (TPR) repeat protein
MTIKNFKATIIFAIFFGLASSIYLSAETPETDTGVKPDDEERPYMILIGQSEKAANEQNWEDAAARLVDAMAVEPENPSNILLMSNLGLIYSYMDQDSLAIVTLDRAHERAPQMVTVLDNRAHIKLKMGRDKDAYEDFAEILELDSLDTDARYYHGIIALYAGNLETAESDFNILKALRPDAHDTAVALSSLYSLTRRDKEAIPYYKRLIKVEPSPEYYASLAGCYLGTGDITEAAAIIAEGLDKYSNDPELYYYRAWLNRDRLLLDDAKSDARRAIALGASPDKVNDLFK